MARAPRSKVSQSSGSGVSRLGYQTGYRLGNRGSASPGSKGTPKVDNAGVNLNLTGGAGNSVGPGTTGNVGMNLTTGDLVPTGSYAKGDQPKASVSLKPTKSKSLASSSDGTSGFLRVSPRSGMTRPYKGI